MPPALRNQRAPTAGDTPAPTAASSVEHPAAIAAQNSWRSSRRATEGRPGDGKAPRPDRSERCFRMAIATSSLKVLRRPLEPKEATRFREALQASRNITAIPEQITVILDNVAKVEAHPKQEVLPLRKIGVAVHH